MNKTKFVLLSALLICVIGISYVVAMTVFQEQRIMKANEFKRDILEELSVNNRTLKELPDDDFNERLHQTIVYAESHAFNPYYPWPIPPRVHNVSTDDLSYSLLLWYVKSENQTVYYTDDGYELFFMWNYTRFVFNVWSYMGN